MRTNRSTFEILGALLGLVILIAVLYAMAGYFRQGATEFDEQARAAGRPITLAEAVVLTDTTAVTETGAVTEAAAVTATAATTASTAVMATAAATDTAPVETAPVTTTAAVTATETTTAVTATAAVTATETTTTAAEITSTTAVTESAVTTATAEVTATATVTTAAEAPAATPSAEELAAVNAIVTKGTCFACHVIPGVPTAVGQVGPDLTHIGAEAATRIPGYTAEQYLRESLLTPNAFLAPKCPTGPCLPNLMVQNLGDTLTAEEIDTLIAYLETLK